MNRDLPYCYKVAGLTVRSEFVLPELMPYGPENEDFDVEIRFASVPKNLPQATTPTPEAEVTENEVLLNIPNIARYLVKDGREIRVEPVPGVEAKEIRLFVLGSALGALYFQRGDFPLHASVVLMNGSAVAFTGDSGAGKSTMAAWMNAQGYPLLCDDVCVVRFDEHGNALAYPGFPRLKLWSDALTAFDIDARNLQRDYLRADKYHLPVPDGFGSDPMPLLHIHILQFSDSDAAPCINEIKPSEAVHLLRENTYRFEYISGLGLTRKHFLDCVKLAKITRLHYLTRPRNHQTLAECQRLVEQQMS